MKILNLYAGIGGNRKLWGDEHEVTAVEWDPEIIAVYRKLYPNDTAIACDAHQYLLDHFQEFDFIWSSPPCPSHSRMRLSLVKSEPVYPDMTLYQEIVFLQHFFKGNWVVENVVPYYKPLIPATVEIDRHLFWTNKPTRFVFSQRNYKGRITDQNKETLAEQYGIELPPGTKNQRKLLRNAVDPRLGLYVFNEIYELEHQAQVNDLVALDLELL
jgi:DNA (cytosine-5)-methyltransferase 1